MIKELVRPLGQGAAFTRLLQQARRLEMHHGLVVHAPAGAGVSTVMQWITAALMCTGSDTAAPCGTCLACRKIASRNHPDVHLLTVPEKKKEIPVEIVRDVLVDLQRFRHEGRARVLQVDPADQLNDEGQNALLKTLEEPLPETFLLLASHKPWALLPTVLSRVVRLEVLGLSDSLLRQELSKRLPQASAHFDRAIRACGGSLGQALELCTERAVQVHDLVLEVIGNLDRLRAVATARAVVSGSKGNEAVQRSLWFLRILRAELRAGLRPQLESAADGAYALRAADRWTALLESTLTAEEDLAIGIPAEQALCGCLLQMQG